MLCTGGWINGQLLKSNGGFAWPTRPATDVLTAQPGDPFTAPRTQPLRRRSYGTERGSCGPRCQSLGVAGFLGPVGAVELPDGPRVVQGPPTGRSRGLPGRRDWCGAWNVKHDGAGFVPRYEVGTEFLARHLSPPQARRSASGTRFFAVSNGEAVAREIPGARLLVMEEAATAIPGAAVGEVSEAMLTLGQRTAGCHAGRRAGVGGNPQPLLAPVRRALRIFRARQATSGSPPAGRPDCVLAG